MSSNSDGKCESRDIKEPTLPLQVCVCVSAHIKYILQTKILILFMNWGHVCKVGPFCRALKFQGTFKGINDSFKVEVRIGLGLVSYLGWLELG